MPARSPDARDECYQRIRVLMGERLDTYYAQHPARWDDQRSKDAIRASVAGLSAIFDILEEYEITRRA